MSKLREQLRHARRAYEAAGYPGDLAAEILPARRAGRPWFFRLAVGGGLAAAAAVVIARDPGGREPAGPTVSVGVAPPPGATGRARRTPLAYRLPDRMPLSLPAAPLVAVTPPVTVSLTGLYDFRPPTYQEIGPRIRDSVRWPNWMQPPAGPKVPLDAGPGAATQQAV